MKEKLALYKKNAKILYKQIKDNWPEIKERALGTEGIIYGSIIVVVLFIITITVQSCTPRKGNILYGMCSEYLKLHIPYPDTIKMTQIDFYRKAVRIYYTHIDAFGEYQLEAVECVFYQDEERGVQLENVFYDNVKEVTKKTRAPGKGKLYEVTKENIDLFNNSRSPAAMMAIENDLIIPDGTAVMYY